jgi:hypothetical protein
MWLYMGYSEAFNRGNEGGKCDVMPVTCHKSWTRRTQTKAFIE